MLIIALNKLEYIILIILTLKEILYLSFSLYFIKVIVFYMKRYSEITFLTKKSESHSELLAIILSSCNFIINII